MNHLPSTFHPFNVVHYLHALVMLLRVVSQIWLFQKNVGAKTIPPSFSVMHSLSDGFSIVLFSNTHNIQQEPYLVHQSMGIRLVLKLGMSLIWNGFLLHCGGKSKVNEDGLHLCDTRWFNYY